MNELPAAMRIDRVRDQAVDGRRRTAIEPVRQDRIDERAFQNSMERAGTRLDRYAQDAPGASWDVRVPTGGRSAAAVFATGAPVARIEALDGGLGDVVDWAPPASCQTPAGRAVSCRAGPASGRWLSAGG